MNRLLLLALLLSSICTKADTLDVLFRYYHSDGQLSASPLQLTLKDGNAVLVSRADAAGWQQWRLENTSRPFHLMLVSGNDSLLLEIDVHEKYRKTVKSVVINRLQLRPFKQVLKVNELTCKWTGSIAYPIGYSFNNPLDGQTLHLKKLRCERTLDSLNVSLYFLSDSVMLFKCGKEEALFFKYYLQSDGKFRRVPSNYTCSEFKNEEQRRLYEVFTRLNGKVEYVFEGKKLVLKDSFCYWEFEFE